MSKLASKLALNSPRHASRPRVAPSQALLAILAAITPAAALPTPDFLCPSLIPRRPRQRRAKSSASSSSSSSSPPSSSTASSSAPSSSTPTTPFPVKYVSDDDGNWHPAESWALHGRHQPTSTTNHRPHPAPGLPRVDDVLAQPTPSTTAMPSGFTDTLPTGWKPMPQRTKFYSVPLIVVFSLILAVVITLVLTGAVLYHKNRRPPDPKRPADADDDDDDEEQVVREVLRRAERDAAKKHRMWGRWRRTARAGLRRRRPFPRPTLDNDDGDDEHHPPRSAGPSRRASIASAREDAHTHTIANDHDSIFLAALAHHHPDPPAPERPSSPPARTPSPVPSAPPTPTTTTTPTAPSPPAYRRITPPKPVPSSSHDPPPPSPRTAHVATDDKAVLARLHSRASAPATDAETQDPAAPQWEDERLEDFADDAGAGPSSAPATVFPLPPPPPPRAVGGDAALYPALPYYARGEDDDEEEGDVGGVPSAPPFVASDEDVASAPPFVASDEGDVHVPSAPPFAAADDDAHVPFAAAPSAPPFAPAPDAHAASAPPLDPSSSPSPSPRLPRYSP